jgi:hypothetical protein
VSRPIQSLAPGFLGLLGMKNNGQLPAELIDALQPVIDESPFMFMGSRDTIVDPVSQNINAVAQFTFPALRVPANEMWYVHGIGVQCSVPGGNTWRGQVAHFTGNVTGIRLGAPESLGAAAAQLYTGLIGGFLANPGDQFGIITSAQTGAGAVTAFGVATVSRFTF